MGSLGPLGTNEQYDTPCINSDERNVWQQIQMQKQDIPQWTESWGEVHEYITKEKVMRWSDLSMRR